MAQSVTLRSMATIVARQSAKYSSTQQLRYYANWRNCALYRQTVSIATNAAPLRTHIIPVIPCFQSFYSTSAPDPAASSGGLRPPDHLDEKERDIFTKLVAQLEPSRLEVQDVSGGCGSMYAIEIASPKFQGLTMMKQHRLVQGVLGEEIKGWHGLQLRTKEE